MVDDWTTVVPDQLSVGDTAKVLLSLARDPRDVRTDGNGTEFRIPPYLADLYNAPPAAPEPTPEATPARPRRRTKKEEGDE